MMLQSSIPGSIEVGKSDLCMSIPKRCEINSVSLPKTCSAQALGIGDGPGGGGGGDGGNIQSCKLCGHSEFISNMLLCDCCEDAFHVPCCKLSVVLPIDEWFCHSCLKIICKLSHNTHFLKEPSISSGIGSCKLEMVPTAVLGIEDSLGGAIKSCKMCGHAENISNMLLCDGCEDAFHVPCCKLSVLPIDEWFCQSCLKEFHILSQSSSSLKPTNISSGIGSCKFELGTDDMQLCKLCGHSEHISNMLLCDQCEEAFHVTCCKPRVRFPIDEWLCHSCSKISRETAQNNSLLKSPSSSWAIGPRLGPLAAMLNYPEPYTSKVRIGAAFQAEVPDWEPLSEVRTDDLDCSSAVVMDPSLSDCADTQEQALALFLERESTSLHHTGWQTPEVNVWSQSYTYLFAFETSIQQDRHHRW